MKRTGTALPAQSCLSPPGWRGTILEAIGAAHRHHTALTRRLARGDLAEILRWRRAARPWSGPYTTLPGRQ